MSANSSPPVPPHRLAVAPMLDWTDRHCRFFHRQLSRGVLLYTEMVTAPAILHGPRERLLGHDAAEHPLALQLGGSDPDALARAVRLAGPFGFDEVNLNCGCPSDRVQSGCFGAVLMRDPALVARCVAAMQDETAAEVTVKCRIGVDEQEPRSVLPAFLEAMAEAGVRRVIVHARKAWLQGLSPKENREVPPLDHPLVFEMARAFPELQIVLNGGIGSLAQARELLEQGALAGVMIGRAAYHEPVAILAGADAALFGMAGGQSAESALAAMLPHVEAHLSAGGRLHQISRHMLGLFAGRPGARLWRQRLSQLASLASAGPEDLRAAAAGIGAGPVAQRD